MPTYQQRFGHAPAPPHPFKTKPLQIKPLQTRSRALATREGGVGVLPHLTGSPVAGAVRSYQAAIRAHGQGDTAGTHSTLRAAGFESTAHGLGAALGALGRNPIIGHKGALGGLEDIAKTFNPAPVVKAIEAERHPIRRFQAEQRSKGLNYSIIGKFGKTDIPAEDLVKSPKPAATPQEVVARSLGTARRLRGEQKKMYSAELNARVGRAQAASEAAGGGVAGHQAAMKELRGELPKTTFENLANNRLKQSDLDALAHHVDMHPDLSFFDKVTINEALRKAVEDKRTPTPSEIKLMQKAFGQDLVKMAKGFSPAKLVIDALNVPRSLMASFDVSAPFRQGLVAYARHPVLASKNMGPMFKSFGSESRYQGLLSEIHSRPNAPLYESSGLNFTELRGPTSANREEQFSSALAEKIPGVGRVVRGSGRAYTAFLDKTRADMFDHQLELARKAGVNVEDHTQLRGIARVVNTATGRGDLGPIESWAPALNTVFFSPRLIASRVNLLNPVWYATLPPYARGQAIRSMVQLGAAAASVLGAGMLLGGKVVNDPRSADFAKLKIGNTRIDELGGLQQYVRLGAQLATGKVISSTTGKTMTLGPGFGQMSREDIAKRFIVGKFSPPASFIDDMLKGTTFAGQPFSVKQAVISRMVPLVAQDSYDLYKSKNSIPLALLGYAISMFGIGEQTYGPKPPKVKHFGGGKGGAAQNPLLGGAGGGSNPYLPSGGGSSNPYLP